MSAPLEDWSPYEPLGVVARSGPPSARPSPERHSVWWRRMLPLLLSDKPAFFGSLGAALLSLIAAILIPRVTMNAIDDALIARTSSLAPYVWILLGLAVFRRDPHLRLPHVALRHRVPARVRPAGHRVRAPHPDVVLVLRPCAVGSADLAGELRHPIGADVPDLRATRGAQPRELRRRAGLHVHDPRRPDARRARHDPIRVHRRRQDAEPDVPTLVDRADRGWPTSRRSSTRT